MDLNKVFFMGNLTRDPEIRTTPNGASVATFGVAHNRKFNQEGQLREEVTFVDVTVWGKTAEICNQYLGKGKKVLIEGRLKLDNWTDQQTGANRSKLSIIGENVTFLSPPDNGNGQQRPQYQQPTGQRSPQQRQTQPQNKGSWQPPTEPTDWEPNAKSDYPPF